jgi:hypothetical protein
LAAHVAGAIDEGPVHACGEEAFEEPGLVAEFQLSEALA